MKISHRFKKKVWKALSKDLYCKVHNTQVYKLQVGTKEYWICNTCNDEVVKNPPQRYSLSSLFKEVYGDDLSSLLPLSNSSFFLPR
jgi:hypothetical protein